MKNVLIGLVLGVLIMLPIGQARNHEYADLPIRYSMTGWVEEAESRTWSFVSADGQGFVLSVDDDVTDILYENMKIRLKQNAGTYLYGFIAKVEASGSTTNVTVYGGTDYTFANEPISDVAFSNVKVPHGFPLDEDKWSVTVTSSTDVTQSSPVSTTWYNVDNIELPTPGRWRIKYKAYLTTADTSLVVIHALTISTANNSESSSNNTTELYFTTGSAIATTAGGTVESNNIYVTTTAKQTLYLNMRHRSATTTSMGVYGTTLPTLIKAVWAGL